MSDSLLVSLYRGVLRVTLNRPGVRNAFDGDLIDALLAAFARAEADDDVRCVVLAGAGKTFCAGADLKWMRSMAAVSQADNQGGARTMAGLFDAVEQCTKPVVGRIQGAAIGGGVGLVASCDIPVATADTVFAFSEVRLGLAPAVISPYVVRRIGVGAARELFVTGSRFDARRAHALGLVNHVAKDEAELDAMVDELTGSIGKGGPRALVACKRLAMQVTRMPADEVLAYTAGVIAELRASPEGQEGMRAFLTRSKPSWVQPRDEGGDP